MFREEKGKASFSRMSGAAIIIAWLFVAIFKAMTTAEIIDLPLGWGSLVAGLYGMNVLSAAFVAKTGGPK